MVQQVESTISDISEDELDNDARQLRLQERAKLLLDKLKTKILATLTTKNIINAAFIIAVCAMCIQQCLCQICEYFKFSTRVQVTHTFPSSSLWLMPGITICTNNRVRLDKLIELVPELAIELEQYTKSEELELASKNKRVEMIRSIREIISNYINISALIDENPIPKLMDLSRASLIKDVDCNSLWGEPYNCENFRIIESYQACSCYTMFYLGAIIEAIATGKAYDFNSSILGGNRKIDSFGDHEVVEIILDFEPSQHADPYRDVGGKLVIHSTGHVGNVGDMTHEILPGQSYDIIIQRYMSSRLPPPYQSMCRDYKFENTPKFSTREGSYPSVELDKTTCVRNCVSQLTTSSCDCWPVEVPYYLGDSLVNNSESYRLCEWISEGNQGNHSAALYVDCYKRFHSLCTKQCQAGCSTESYQVSVMTNTWPTRSTFLRASTADRRRELLRLKSCCSKISIKYMEFQENRFKMYPSMTLAQLVSNLGGIISGLVGVSAVTIYRYLTRKVFHCRVVSDYSPQTLLDSRQAGIGINKNGKQGSKRSSMSSN